MVYQPSKALHPGLTLQRVLDSSSMSQKNLAERTGLSEKHISQIINGESSVTVETALLLENALGGSAAFWSNLEKNYQETLSRISRKSQMEKEIPLLQNFPYRDLAAYGYVSKTRNQLEKVENLWKFFGVNSLLFVSNTEAVAYRRQDGSGVKSEALATWLRCGELDSKKLSLNEFDGQKLRQRLIELRKMTKGYNNFFQDLQNTLSEVGVGLVCVPHFANTQVHGATRWIGDNPLLQLSIRGRDSDKFWFTLFHEIGHVLYHGKKEEFLEYDKSVEDEKETEADSFAQRTLIPNAIYKEFVRRNDFSITAIKGFAKYIETDPGIVLGRLKHDGLVPYSHLSQLHSKLVLKMSNE